MSETEEKTPKKAQKPAKRPPTAGQVIGRLVGASIGLPTAGIVFFLAALAGVPFGTATTRAVLAGTIIFVVTSIIARSLVGSSIARMRRQREQARAKGDPA